MNGFMRYALAATPVCVIVFLTWSFFFTSWDGKVVSFRPVQAEEPATYRVLIVTDDRDTSEADWPAQVVRDLQIPGDATGLPPMRIPETAPATSKSSFSLSFEVQREGESKKVVSTLSALPFYSSVLLWLIGLVVHNMWLSGSPWSAERRELELPSNPQAAGQPTQGPAKPRGRKGPPPQKRRVGQGRRR
jgi:hypothetical protein